MRRLRCQCMVRWGLTSCLAVSLFACIIGRWMYVGWASERQPGWVIQLECGALFVSAKYAAPFGAPSPGFELLCDYAATDNPWTWGFRFEPPYNRYVVPWWPLVAALALPVAGLWTAAIKRRRRASGGKCARCGYD